MKKFKTYIPLLLLLSGFSAQGQDQTTDIDRYRRLSRCDILVSHSNEKFADEIEEEFLQLPVSEQFNDHNLSVRVISTPKKLNKDSEIKGFVERNNLASRLVAKWFNRNLLTGECDMDLVRSRGLYDATAFDAALADMAVRGKAMLEDAGEDLISNTYLLMHDVTYVDKGKRSRTWALVGAIALGALGAYGGQSNDQIQKTMQDAFDVISSYKGFGVKIHTYLYRLVWDDETANTFYTRHFSDTPDKGSIKSFESERGKYRLEYIGDVVSKGGRTSFLGINEQEPNLMIRKATQRALDDNVADLMKKYDSFRIKAPVVTVKPTITAQIGMKEGVAPGSKFEVLEPREDNGKMTYKRVAVITPAEGRIWDNRFMAVEEKAYGADFNATTFKKVSGGDIIPGYLIRQIE